MTAVYIVKEGDEAQSFIRAVFSTRAKAEEYCADPASRWILPLSISVAYLDEPETLINDVASVRD